MLVTVRGMLPDHKAEIRRQLINPRDVCERLGLLEGYRPVKQANGITIRCPMHDEKTPSCSVSIGKDGTLRVHCFGHCGLDGDVFALIAAVHNLDKKRDFSIVLQLAAEMAGLSLENNVSIKTYTPVLPPKAVNPCKFGYPPINDVLAFWEKCIPVFLDDDVDNYLVENRRLRSELIVSRDLARVLKRGETVPDWATCGKPWPESGHRLIVPVYDSSGSLRSVRAWDFSETAPSKRVAPKGFSTAGLVLANDAARGMLMQGPTGPCLDVTICEGEPDFLTWATIISEKAKHLNAVFGVFSGAWVEDVAARIPNGSRVAIRTHGDDTGKRYAEEIKASLKDRCVLYVHKDGNK